MATKKNSSAKSPQATSRSNRDSMRWILGLLLLFAGLFLTASVLFYYFDWRADMSLVSGVEQEDPRLADLSDAIENPCGYAGAWLAERLVGRSFGLFGIILPLIVTMVGVRIIRQRPLLFNHSVLGALLILILGSLTLGFAFGEKWAVFGSGWGGAFGVEVARRLTSVIGVLGNIILLLGAWILTGVFINRNFINTVNTAGNAMVDKGGKIVDLVKQSVVNVADHRSKSGEEKTDPEPEPDSKPESERPQPEPVPAPVDASARTSAADGAAEVTIQRSGMALMLWLAGMTPVACLAAWGACLVLGLEQAWLLAGFTGWGGFWGLPVFVATLFPQVVFYIPVFWLLLSWALAKERRIRTAGFLILLLVLGMGTALEVWLNPGFVSLLVSHCPF